MDEQQYEDRIFILEDALTEAWHLADFLYHCLESEGYDHSYPSMSQATLDRLAPLLPKRKLCLHSVTQGDCEACQELVARFKRRAEVKERA